jgi:MoaA/NifB/PqqE/SkfB family radical SAM enzyme
MSQQGIYSENKLIWWAYRDGGLPSAPKQVQLILSDLCNQSCSFCAYRMDGYTSNELFMAGSEAAAYGHNNPKRWIPTERALGLLTEFSELGVLAVQFTGGGEPTVHPDHDKLFRRALDLGLRCSLVSNGLKWSQHLTKTILPRFDWVRVSIDASLPSTYAETRRTPVSAWTQVWKNVLMLTDSVAEVKSQTQVGLGFVVTPSSFEEIPRFAHIASKSGVANIRYTAMFSPEDEKPFAASYDRIRGLIQESRKFERPGFAIYDNFGSRFDDLHQHAPDYKTCSYQHYTAYVGGDLHAYRCCVLAYNQRGRVAGGDLRERSFAEFWRSQERKDDMAALDARGCERCQFNEKNRALLYVMGDTASDTTPRHLEWP